VDYPTLSEPELEPLDRAGHFVVTEVTPCTIFLLLINKHRMVNDFLSAGTVVVDLLARQEHSPTHIVPKNCRVRKCHIHLRGLWPDSQNAAQFFGAQVNSNIRTGSYLIVMIP
jgi:hypothetical protein